LSDLEQFQQIMHEENSNQSTNYQITTPTGINFDYLNWINL